jgi:hypothetical protein
MPSLPTENNRLVLAERPKRGPVNDKTFRYESAKIPQLEDGNILVKIDYVSIVSRRVCPGRTLLAAIGGRYRRHDPRFAFTTSYTCQRTILTVGPYPAELA